MTEWLLRQLEITNGKDFADHLDKVQLAFRVFPDWYWYWVLAAAILVTTPVAVFVWLRQKWNLPSAPPALRFTLTAARVLIFFILVLILARPYLRLDLKDEHKPIVAVLLDHSESMRLPYGQPASEDELTAVAQAAGYRSTSATADSNVRQALPRSTRAKIAHNVLANGARPFLEGLAKKFDVQYYSFAKSATRLGVDPASPDLPEPPNPGGNHTWIGDAVGHVLDEAGDRQVAGILVLSDGQNNGGRSLAEVAQLAAAHGAPIFTVPVGSPRRLQDVAITDLFTTGLVTVGDVARVAVTVESQGFDGRTVKVELKDSDKLLDSKDIVLRDTEQQQVELTFKATEPGARYLTVKVPEQPEEAPELRANNADTAFVRVSDEKIKVLLVEGLPRWDFRFLKNALRRDNGVGGRFGKEVDVRLEAEWRRLPDAEKARALPRTLEHLAEYHSIILGDVSPKMLDSGFIDLLEKAVTERGVGLIVAAGPLSMPQQYDHRLQNLLPVRMRMDRSKGKPTNIPWFRLDLAPEGAIHEATRFYDDPGRNQNAWSNLPRYYWYADAERAQPGATVLVYNPVLTNYGKVPLIAHHYAGKGKVMFVGTDETFRWRQNVGDRFFYKFWGQSVRFVARRDAATEKKSRIEVRPVRAQPGEAAQIELMAFAPDGSPRTEPTQEVQVQGGESATTVELTADPAVKGRYTGKFTPSQAGEYRVGYSSPGSAESVEARLRVAVAPEELRQPNVNRPALETLAVRAGGRMVELPEIAGIGDSLEGQSKFTELHREASLWDNKLTLIVLIFLYCLDVGLRRLVGLS
jgi:hypothetical protein